MDERVTLSLLEALAEQLDIQVRYDRLTGDEPLPGGGLCRVKGAYVIIIDRKATTGEKIMILAEALRHFDLETVYVRPALRELLEAMPPLSDVNHIQREVPKR
ncbi:MAG: hypothetical protein JXO48_01500 [Deltaproteobacteria bacterium]|nr:hypothetical protein [Deltaproteobacteria bacterium]